MNRDSINRKKSKLQLIIEKEKKTKTKMTDGKISSVSFACQRCLQPLQLEDSFDNMSIHALAELDCKYQYYFMFSCLLLIIFYFCYLLYHYVIHPFSTNTFKCR